MEFTASVIFLIYSMFIALEHCLFRFTGLRFSSLSLIQCKAPCRWRVLGMRTTRTIAIGSDFSGLGTVSIAARKCCNKTTTVRARTIFTSDTYAPAKMITVHNVAPEVHFDDVRLRDEALAPQAPLHDTGVRLPHLCNIYFPKDWVYFRAGVFEEQMHPAFWWWGG